MEGVLPADPAQGLGVGQNPEEDGIAVGLDGKIYSDSAITDAIAQVGQLGPLNPKVAICHFPPQERSQFQVRFRMSAQHWGPLHAGRALVGTAHSMSARCCRKTH